ncbi:unnamed protein product [Echinostoma caproni]|uniref:RPL18A n=1 Tax=Echinostoma caproni TaxID=27848 RepID=A0A183A458_9TREM|nr:unnamed protein product [Echinostoma caproni]
MWNYLAVTAQRESPAHKCKNLDVNWPKPKVLTKHHENRELGVQEPGHKLARAKSPVT